MTATPTNSPVRLDPSGRVDEDLPCAGCDYNVRGASAVGTCAECGFAVADSIRLDRLLFGRREWLRKLVRGATLLLIAYAVGVASILPAIAIRSLVVTVFGWVVMAALAAAGAWFLTEPSGNAAIDRRTRWRPLARFFMIAFFVVFVGWLLNDRVFRFWRTNVISVALPLVAAAGMSSLLMHLAHLASKVPAKGLAVASRIVAVLIAVDLPLVALVNLGVARWFRGWGYIIAIGVFVLPCVLVWLMEKYRYRLRTVMKGAEARRFAIA
jgi:hypothetical protein